MTKDEYYLDKRGDLRFISKPEGRTWQSKKGEPFSEFIARIVRDLENGGANIKQYLLEDLKQ